MDQKFYYVKVWHWLNELSEYESYEYFTDATKMKEWCDNFTEHWAIKIVDSGTAHVNKLGIIVPD